MIDDYEIIEKLSRRVCELHAENERLRARVAELSGLVGYLAGRNNDHIRVMLAGNPDVCDRLIDRARAALEAKP